MISKTYIKGDKFWRVLNQINAAHAKRSKTLYVTKFKNIEKLLVQLQKAKILCNFFETNNSFFLLLTPTYYSQKMQVTYPFKMIKKMQPITTLQKVMFKKNPNEIFATHTKKGINIK